jgi:hypothetical protein
MIPNAASFLSRLSSALAVAPVMYEALPAEVAAGTPLDLVFKVFPGHASNRLLVGRRSNGRERDPVWAERDGDDPTTGVQRFRVRMPPVAPGEAVEYSPQLTRAGQVVERLPARSTRGVHLPPVPAPAATPRVDGALPAGAPRYRWASEFLGAFTVKLIVPPDTLGPGPDGMHITYLIDSGEIHGPRLNGRMRGGDWMLLRQDGIGVANARVTYEMDDGVLLMSQYYGIADFGSDGYARAARNEFDPSPPLVLAPQFISSHPDWLWLNRLQCLAVGRADLANLIVRADIYAIRSGEPLASSGLPLVGAPALVGDVH